MNIGQLQITTQTAQYRNIMQRFKIGNIWSSQFDALFADNIVGNLPGIKETLSVIARPMPAVAGGANFNGIHPMTEFFGFQQRLANVLALLAFSFAALRETVAPDVTTH